MVFILGGCMNLRLYLVLKESSLILITLVMCFSVFANGSSEKESAKSEVEIALAAAEKMSNEELYAKAKAEVGTMKD